MHFLDKLKHFYASKDVNSRVPFSRQQEPVKKWWKEGSEWITCEVRDLVKLEKRSDDEEDELIADLKHPKPQQTEPHRSELLTV